MVGRLMSDFVFCTGRYESGDWDSAPSLPANLIDSIARYTGIPVAPTGAIVPLASDAILEFPLVYLTGHLPFRFSDAERRNARKLVERGGMIFIDDHNHDIGGVFHKTAMEEITRSFSQPKDLPNDHPIYRCFFKFDDGPPTTSHELNGWGDNVVHGYLRGVEPPNWNAAAIGTAGTGGDDALDETDLWVAGEMWGMGK